MSATQYTVYRLYDANDALLYVGRTDNLERRLAHHATQAPWWSEVVRQEDEQFDTYGAAFNAERRMIQDLAPRHNIHRWDPKPVDPPKPPKRTAPPLPFQYSTTTEAARRLGIARGTLLRWAKDGVVTPALITPGGQYRWDVTNLLA